MNYLDHIVRDPNICGGEPVIRGTRVTLRTILASLAEGAPDEDILEDFPAVTKADLRAVIAFAARSAEEDLPVPGISEFDDENFARREPAGTVGPGAARSGS